MPVDIWSTGCILAEMLGRGRPVFPGANEREQMLLIVKKLGSPVIYESSFIKHPTARSFMRSLPPQRKVPWCSVFGEAETSLLDLLDRMLCFDPELRITAIEALEHEAVAEQSTLRECSRCGSNFTNSIRQSITNQRTQDYTVDLGTVERAPANEDSYRLLLLSQVFDLHVCQNVVDRQEETPSARSRCGRRSSWAS
jgi:serine/threonine protein kinase